MGRRSLAVAGETAKTRRMANDRAMPAVDTLPLSAGLPPLEEAPHVAPLERLLHVLDTHASVEEGSLIAYRAFAQALHDPIAAILMRLILDDEDRHHALFRQMATRLRDDIEWSQSPEALPPAKLPTARSSEDVIAVTRDYLADEREGARQLRRLARQMPDLHGGLYALLLEVMARDSEKHERILAFILRRLTAVA